MSEAVIVERLDGVMVVTINRPEARNAINAAVSAGIAAAMRELDAAPELAIGIVTGAGGTFCAGMDLKAFLAGEMGGGKPGRGMATLTERPPRKPVIAAIEGYALAGGCELALACDLRVAAENATFGLPEVKRGLIAAGGGLLVLSRLIPPAIAMQLALTGDPFSAADAYRYGLVNTLTAPGEALAGALALAKRITVNGPLAVAASKELMTRAQDLTLDEGWEEQQAIAASVFTSEDAREGARAFAEKRPALWKGR
ncbi:MAG: crotonase/enoyl-CoA hydratase family protein [Trebonia sp.]|jgi:enoyl-CoA hydratase